MLKVITASLAKKRLLELLDEVQQTPLLVTRSGQPAAVILSAEEYEALMETVKFLAYPYLAQANPPWKNGASSF
ncbi:MAG: type II toxin-antitoxin system Phd/YefM family antitoxin [Coprothermobacterota bacterium]|nr:type II toxin-antitoxin system Phd/YefM family antitoxin [Coprothermobacterota bacterium]